MKSQPMGSSMQQPLVIKIIRSSYSNGKLHLLLGTIGSAVIELESLVPYSTGWCIDGSYSYGPICANGSIIRLDSGYESEYVLQLRNKNRRELLIVGEEVKVGFVAKSISGIVTKFELKAIRCGSEDLVSVFIVPNV